MPNSVVVRVREHGGNLIVTIPRQLWREVGWARRDYVRVFRSGAAQLTLTRAEVDRRGAPDVSAAPAR